MSKIKRKRIGRMIFLGKKSYSISAIKFLLNLGIQIPILILDKDTISKNKDFLRKSKIDFYEDDSIIHRKIEEKSDLVGNIDLVVSYLYWKKIKQEIIDLPSLGCLNFHPAPLPKYKGRAGYNTAILDKSSSYGVSVHFIDSEKIDSGPIIDVQRFKIDSEKINAYQLGIITQKQLLDLFKRTIRRFVTGKKITTKENKGGLYLSKEELENLKIIKRKEAKEEIDRKIRAFFFPPYSGAQIEINGSFFTVVNEEILKYIHDLIDEKN